MLAELGKHSRIALMAAVVAVVSATGVWAQGATRLINLSTRGQVQTGDNVMIGGFIVSGATPKKVLIRAVGPNLANYGVAGVLADPMLELHKSSDGSIVASNNNWGDAANAAEIQASGLAPSVGVESAILGTFSPGAYTAIVSGYGGGTGVAIIEVYEIDTPNSAFTNISTRGLVLTGDSRMIGGFIIQGSTPQTVLIRAVGPTLANHGVAGTIANPVLELYKSSDGSLVASNDDWGSAANASAITLTGLAPQNSLESAILIALQPGAYTAVVSGANGGTGVGIVEVFAMASNTPVSGPAVPVLTAVPAQTATVGTPLAPLDLSAYASAASTDPVTSLAPTSGALPPGLNLNVLTQLIEGTPISPGGYDVALVARNKAGSSTPVTLHFDVAAPAASIPPIFAEVPETRMVVGTALAGLNLSAYVTPTDGDPVLNFAIIAGALPDGLALDTATGMVSGTPGMLAIGPYSVDVVAHDKDGASNAARVWLVVSQPWEALAPDLGALPASMTLAQRYAALESISQFVNASWSSANLAADKTPLVNFIQSLPDFADAGLTDSGRVWARFKDGRATLVSFDGGRPSARPLRAATGVQSPGTRSFVQAGAGVGPKTAVVINIDNLGRSASGTVASYLSRAGYSTTQPAGTLVNLMTKIRDVTVLHHNGHGEFFPDRSGVGYFWLSTADHAPLPTDPVQLAAVQKMVDDELLSFYIEQNDQGQWSPNFWLINEKFVRRFWRLDSDSFVFIDTCQLFNPSAGPRSLPSYAFYGYNFRKALQEATANHSTYILGWDNYANADFAAGLSPLLFDRALGVNREPPLGQPPFRPFAGSRVYSQLNAQNQITDPQGTKLKAEQLVSAQTSTGSDLRPDIKSVSLSPPGTWTNQGDKWRLEIAGGDLSFGKVPGTLSIAGVDVPAASISKWTSSSVQALLPYVADAAPPAGSVVVGRDGLLSNAAPLTRWTGTVRQTFTDTGIGKGALVLIDCPVRTTMDVHYGRGTDPSSPLGFSLADYGDLAAPGCSYTMSGSWSDLDTNYTLTGSGTVRPRDAVGNVAGHAMTHMLFFDTLTVSALPTQVRARINGPTIAWCPELFPSGTIDQCDRAVKGTLTAVSKATGQPLANYPKPVFSQWQTFYSGGHYITLGLDYSISTPASSDCSIGIWSNCQETWLLMPDAATVPTANTPS